jgi:elongation factor P
MAVYGTNEFRAGLKVMQDGDPCNIIENQFVKPGKGQAFNRVKLRNLKTGRVLERTFKSGETVEGADVVDTDMQYLYQDGEGWHFMDPSTYEQYIANLNAMAGAEKWLKGEDICQITLYNGSPISVVPPKVVTLTITESAPAVRGDTTSGATKAAIVETGAEVKVPLFVKEGDIIKVDTRTGEYVSRAKE